MNMDDHDTAVAAMMTHTDADRASLFGTTDADVWAFRSRHVPLRTTRSRASPPSESTTSTPRRVFHTLRRMELTGSTVDDTTTTTTTNTSWKRHGVRARLQTVADLPRPFIADRNFDDAREYENSITFNGQKRGFAHLLREIYDILDVPQSDKKPLSRLVHDLMNRLLEPHFFQGFHGDDGGDHPSDATMEAVTAERERFLRLGGAECLLRVVHVLRLEDPALASVVPATESIAASATSLEDHAMRHRRNVTDRADVRAMWSTPSPVNMEMAAKMCAARPELRLHRSIMNDVLGLLRELCFFSLPLTRDLCDKDGLIVYLFQLLEINKFFDSAAGLVKKSWPCGKIRLISAASVRTAIVYHRWEGKLQ